MREEEREAGRWGSRGFCLQLTVSASDLAKAHPFIEVEDVACSHSRVIDRLESRKGGCFHLYIARLSMDKGSAHSQPCVHSSRIISASSCATPPFQPPRIIGPSIRSIRYPFLTLTPYLSAVLASDCFLSLRIGQTDLIHSLSGKIATLSIHNWNNYKTRCSHWHHATHPH